MADDFGFEAVNEQNSVLINTLNRPLIFNHRSQISLTNSVVDRPAVGSVSFPKVITTNGPPRIFVRLNSSRHGSLSCYVTLNGSPGNWTGFTMYAAAQGGGTLPLYVLDYVAAIPSGGVGTDPTSEWGFVLYDENGVPLFNHENRVVRFGKFTRNWTYSRASAGNNLTYHTFYSNVTIDSDDYIDVTYFNRGVVFQPVVNAMFTGLVLYSGSTRVLFMQTQASNFTDIVQDVGITNHVIPICKFPINRYP